VQRKKLVVSLLCLDHVDSHSLEMPPALYGNISPPAYSLSNSAFLSRIQDIVHSMQRYIDQRVHNGKSTHHLGGLVFVVMGYDDVGSAGWSRKKF
jgi:hypothetical protein